MMAKTKIIGKTFIQDELEGILKQQEECKNRFNMLEGAKQTLEQQLKHLEEQNSGEGEDDSPDPAATKPGDSDGEVEEKGPTAGSD